MGENLVIVESPAKAKTIAKYLGKDFDVRSCKGHIRDLPSKDDAIDVENGFELHYEIPSDKKKTVAELKEALEGVKTVWLASDEDREGEAISWHLYEILGLKDKDTKRIAFHEITKPAILEALKHPRELDFDLINAQQARRALDRLVGYDLSPILWRKLQSGLSAGRVQSVAVRLIADREREIAAFENQQYFKVDGMFLAKEGHGQLKASLDRRFATEKEAEDFLGRCIGCNFAVEHIETKEASKSPAAPFTTSVLQQEASRKLGYSVSQTMQIAQSLYEKGFITYMRTDSVNLSSLAVNTAKNYILGNYGEQYSKVRQYKTRTRGAQEAHEAIRPTFIENVTIDGTAQEKRLYELIWKRTVASQMADARVERTVITIGGDKIEEKFIIEGEKVLFDGFLKVYIEGHDDEPEEEAASNLPAMSCGDVMQNITITALQKYTTGPQRYSEASLVKKLEELGIGRPSTYAPTITTIIHRGYVQKGDVAGREYNSLCLTLAKGAISRKTSVEKLGRERKKLIPENIGMVVNDFLTTYFPNIVDFNFTADVEAEFDEIAQGRKQFSDVLGDFYGPFKARVNEVLEMSVADFMKHSARELGVDPKSGKKMFARMARYGAVVQVGEDSDPEKKYASLKSSQLIESITLEDALKLFDLPRVVGTYEGNEITANIGKFGPYVRCDSKFYSIPKTQSPYEITEEEAIALIREKMDKDRKELIAEFPEHEILVLNGRYGPYIKQGKKNYKIPKGVNPSTLDAPVCLEIIKNSTK